MLIAAISTKSLKTCHVLCRCRSVMSFVMVAGGPRSLVVCFILVPTCVSGFEPIPHRNTDSQKASVIGAVAELSVTIAVGDFQGSSRKDGTQIVLGCSAFPSAAR